MHHLHVYFFPQANEVTFIQSQIISFPFSLLAERKNLYREVKRGAVSLFAIFNLVCVEGNTRTIKIQTIWDRGDNPPALLSEVRGRHWRGVSRDYERKWCLNGSLSDLFSTLWWQRLIRGEYWKSLSQKWPNPVGGNVIMVLWCADLLSRGNGRGNQPGGQIWLRPVGQMTSVVSFQSWKVVAQFQKETLCLNVHQKHRAHVHTAEQHEALATQ